MSIKSILSPAQIRRASEVVCEDCLGTALEALTEDIPCECLVHCVYPGHLSKALRSVANGLVREIEDLDGPDPDVERIVDLVTIKLLQLDPDLINNL